ncbi:MAG: putative lipid II flippase FtsW [Peptococcaceae bacterium]|nr:putative lipid II flippase FtsW [Peptococcaceae bacterium]
MAKEKGKRKRKFQKPDLLLAALAFIILAFGLVMVLSAGARFSYQQGNTVYHLFLLQLMWAFFGLAAALLAFMIPFNKWRRICGVALVAVGGLLILAHVPGIGVQSNDAARWVNIFGLQLQPSELAKLAIVIFLAHNFDQYPVRRFRDAWWPCLLVLGITVLVLTEDLGSGVIMLATLTAMLFQTGLSLRYFVVGIPTALCLGWMYISTHPRIQGWLDPWNNFTDIGHQTALSQYVLAMGGLFGIGMGGNAGARALPESYNDMIFSVIGQELGFFGAVVFLLGLALFIMRCYYVSYRCQDHFGRLLGFGVSSLIAIQSGINICAAIGVMPITGVTLPLVSYGGTSLLISLFEVGILLNISRGMTKEVKVRASRISKSGVSDKNATPNDEQGSPPSIQGSGTETI